MSEKLGVELVTLKTQNHSGHILSSQQGIVGDHPLPGFNNGTDQVGSINLSS